MPSAVPKIAAARLPPSPSTKCADRVAARLLPTRSFFDLSIDASIQRASDTRNFGAHVYVAPLPWCARLPHSHSPRTPGPQRLSPLHRRCFPRRRLHRLKALHPRHRASLRLFCQLPRRPRHPVTRYQGRLRLPLLASKRGRRGLTGVVTSAAPGRARRGRLMAPPLGLSPRPSCNKAYGAFALSANAHRR